MDNKVRQAFVTLQQFLGNNADILGRRTANYRYKLFDMETELALLLAGEEKMCRNFQSNKNKEYSKY